MSFVTGMAAGFLGSVSEKINDADKKQADLVAGFTTSVGGRLDTAMQDFRAEEKKAKDAFRYIGTVPAFEGASDETKMSYLDRVDEIKTRVANNNTIEIDHIKGPGRSYEDLMGEYTGAPEDMALPEAQKRSFFSDLFSVDTVAASNTAIQQAGKSRGLSDQATMGMLNRPDSMPMAGGKMSFDLSEKEKLVNQGLRKDNEGKGLNNIASAMKNGFDSSANPERLAQLRVGTQQLQVDYTRSFSEFEQKKAKQDLELRELKEKIEVDDPQKRQDAQLAFERKSLQYGMEQATAQTAIDLKKGELDVQNLNIVAQQLSNEMDGMKKDGLVNKLAADLNLVYANTANIMQATKKSKTMTPVERANVITATKAQEAQTLKLLELLPMEKRKALLANSILDETLKKEIIESWVAEETKGAKAAAPGLANQLTGAQTASVTQDTKGAVATLPGEVAQATGLGQSAMAKGVVDRQSVGSDITVRNGAAIESNLRIQYTEETINSRIEQEANTAASGKLTVNKQVLDNWIAEQTKGDKVNISAAKAASAKFEEAILGFSAKDAGVNSAALEQNIAAEYEHLVATTAAIIQQKEKSEAMAPLERKQMETSIASLQQDIERVSKLLPLQVRGKMLDNRQLVAALEAAGMSNEVFRATMDDKKALPGAQLAATRAGTDATVQGNEFARKSQPYRLRQEAAQAISLEFANKVKALTEGAYVSGQNAAADDAMLELEYKVQTFASRVETTNLAPAIKQQLMEEVYSSINLNSAKAAKLGVPEVTIKPIQGAKLIAKAVVGSSNLKYKFDAEGQFIPLGGQSAEADRVQAEIQKRTKAWQDSGSTWLTLTPQLGALYAQTSDFISGLPPKEQSFMRTKMKALEESGRIVPVDHVYDREKAKGSFN